VKTVSSLSPHSQLKQASHPVSTL